MKNGKKRLLFVDDEPNCLKAMERMLHGQRQVWEMHFVSSVREALEAVGENDFDMVISDVSMPEQDGFTLLAALREDEKTKDLPVVMLTGVGDDDLKCLALNQGATDLLSKPVSFEDLMARIRSVLHLKAYQDELRQLNNTLERKVAERTRDLENSHIDILWRLAKAGEYRDEATGEYVFKHALVREGRLLQPAPRQRDETARDVCGDGLPDGPAPRHRQDRNTRQHPAQAR